MEKIHISKCPVCNDNYFEKLFICNDFLVSTEKFTLFKCKKCGFVFTQDFPDENAIEKYYDTPEYISHSDTQHGFVNFFYHLARKISLYKKVKLVQKFILINNGNLLDIGAGTGYFINSIKNAGWTVSGIEKSEAARNLAHQKFALQLFDADEIVKIADSSNDVITMWHSLEHIENLNDTLENLYRILKSDGILIIALPNRTSVDAHHYRQFWAAYDVPRHLWHFSPTDFNQISKNHNFKIIKIKSMLLDPFYISILSEKYKKTPVATLIGLIKGTVFTIQSILNNKKCSSLIYILKKQ